MSDAQTQLLVQNLGTSDPATFVLVTGLGTSIQALVIGAALQLLFAYCQKPIRETLTERVCLGILWFIAIFQVIANNVQSAIATAALGRYVSFMLLDWWFFQLSSLYFNVALALLLGFFTKRAWVIWDRQRWVLVLCLALAIPTVCLGISAAVIGLQAPWGLGFLSQQEINDWVPVWLLYFIMFAPVFVASVSLQLVTNSLLCVLILYGLWRHRSGFSQMDTAISKIIFICSESLVPSLLLSVVFVIAVAFIRNDSTNVKGVLLVRICGQICPSVYLHSLMSTLVSRERVKRVLQAEPVRCLPEMQGVASSPAEVYKHEYARQISDYHPGSGGEKSFEVRYYEGRSGGSDAERGNSKWSGSGDAHRYVVEKNRPPSPSYMNRGGMISSSMRQPHSRDVSPLSPLSRLPTAPQSHSRSYPGHTSGQSQRQTGQTASELTTTTSRTPLGAGSSSWGERNQLHRVTSIAASFPNTHPIATYRSHDDRDEIDDIDMRPISFEEFLGAEDVGKADCDGDSESHISLTEVDIARDEEVLGWRRGSRRSTYLYEIEEALRKGPEQRVDGDGPGAGAGVGAGTGGGGLGGVGGVWRGWAKGSGR